MPTWDDMLRRGKDYVKNDPELSTYAEIGKTGATSLKQVLDAAMKGFKYSSPAGWAFQEAGNPEANADMLSSMGHMPGGMAAGGVPPMNLKSIVGDALDMSQEARLARAKSLGFDVETPVYHGTEKTFDTFKPSESGLQGPGIYTTTNTRHASSYAGGDTGTTAMGANVMPLYTKGNIYRPPEGSDIEREVWKLKDQNKISLWDEALKQFREKLKSEGYSGLQQGQTRVVFDPKDIRSVNARFDPNNSGSGNILSSILAGTIGGATLGSVYGKPDAEDN